MPQHDTFFLEELGSTILEPLLTATKHESAVVREGAVLGLDNAIQLALKRLIVIASNDSSAGVREIAEGALGDVRFTLTRSWRTEEET